MKEINKKLRKEIRIQLGNKIYIELERDRTTIDADKLYNELETELNDIETELDDRL
jgi:prefoldin subunit 5